MKPVLVAGHICLDIIPALPEFSGFLPGQLQEVGPARLSTGGAVSNVGRALDRLGVPVQLLGVVGDDLFGRNIQSLLGSLGHDLVTASDVGTSYTVVLDPPGSDRMFLHHPGANARFSSDHVSAHALASASHLHFGYPTLMEQISSANGQELRMLFERARLAGLTTSLDLTVPDPSSRLRDVYWPELLANVLPFVDDFLPSRDDLAPMFHQDDPVHLVTRCHELGAERVLLKCGERGALISDGQDVYWQEPHPADFVGATGAGDAFIAGYLYGKRQDLDLRRCTEIAAIVGAACCEAADAVSGIPTEPELLARLRATMDMA